MDGLILWCFMMRLKIYSLRVKPRWYNQGKKKKNQDENKRREELTLLHLKY